MANYIVVMSM